MQHITFTRLAWRRPVAARTPAAEAGPSWVPALLADLVAFGPLVLMFFL